MSEGMDETYRSEDDLEFESWIRQTSDTLAEDVESYLGEVEAAIVNTTKATCMQIQSYLGGEEETTIELPVQRRSSRFRIMLSILGMLLIQR